MKFSNVNDSTRQNRATQNRSVGLVCLGMAVCMAHGPAVAQVDAWQVSLGGQRYSESNMQLAGPELGVHWKSKPTDAWQYEADALLGIQKYSSDESGTMKQIPNFDTRWRALASTDSLPSWHWGLALHTHFNNFRGVTHLGYAGYDRITAQIWLPIRWRSGGSPTWEWDAGWLLWGQHVSRLSQVGIGNEDAINVQRSGVYLQASTTLQSVHGEWAPFARWTWVGASDQRLVKIAGELRPAYEPQNSRVQLGLRYRFR